MKKTDEEILQEKLEESPYDLDILNEIAIFYLNNPSISNKKHNPELRYFQEAYDIKKTVKSTNNLAYYFYFEDWKKEEQAIKIQIECLSLNPKSYIPYALYGYFMLEKNNPAKAIAALEKAKEKFQTQQILNNLAIAYLYQEKTEQAKSLLKESINNYGYSECNMYNLSLIYLKDNKLDKSMLFLSKIEDKIKNTPSSFDIDYLQLAEIYSSINEHEKASDLALAYAGSFDFISYKSIAYSLFISKKDIFYKTYEEIINENKEKISEIETDHKDWEKETEEEKRLIMEECRKTILKHENMEKEFKVSLSQPSLNLKDVLCVHPCPCLLFGCTTHANLYNDLQA